MAVDQLTKRLQQPFGPCERPIQREYADIVWRSPHSELALLLDVASICRNGWVASAATLTCEPLRGCDLLYRCGVIDHDALRSPWRPWMPLVCPTFKRLSEGHPQRDSDRRGRTRPSDRRRLNETACRCRWQSMENQSAGDRRYALVKVGRKWPVMLSPRFRTPS